MDPIQTLMVFTGAMFALGCSVAVATFAMATVCKWMDWTPVRIVLTLNDYRDL